jgi:hypothetical protein
MRRLLGLASLVIVLSGSMTAQQEKGDKEIAFQGTISIPFEGASDNTFGTLVPRFGYFLSARNFIGLENDDILGKGYQAAGLNLLYRFYFGKRGSRFQPYLGLAPGILSQRTDVDVQIVVSSSSYNAAFNQIASATNLTAALKSSDEKFLNNEVQAYEEGCFLSSTTASCTTVPSGIRKVTTGDFQGSGEFGIKFYLSRKFAFETSYRLTYVHQSAPFAQDIYTVTNSTLTPTNYLVSFGGPTHSDGQAPGGAKFKQEANNLLLFGFAYVF